MSEFDRIGTLSTYNLIDALSRNPTLINAGADIADEAQKTILRQADRIEALEANLAKAVEALENIAGKVSYADDPWDIACAALKELEGETNE